MTKCDFCTNSYYTNDGKIHCGSPSSVACGEAVKIMSEVLKEQYRSQSIKNINKNYKYERNK